MTFGEINLIAALGTCERSFNEDEKSHFYNDIYRIGWDGRSQLFIGEASYFLHRASPLKYQKAMHEHCLVMNEDTQ